MGCALIRLSSQDWTKQESVDAEGVVTFTYRTQPDEPPDIKTIQKQMAIVAWQPGSNRVVETPSEVSLLWIPRQCLRDCSSLCNMLGMLCNKLLHRVQSSLHNSSLATTVIMHQVLAALLATWPHHWY